MALSTKQALLNYLEFLKECGLLYMEGFEEPPPVPVLSHSLPATPKPQPIPQPATRKPQPSAPSAPTTIPHSALRTPHSSAPLSREERVAALAQAAARAESCRACALGSQRSQTVFFDGDPLAKIVFVGEAPGFHEDQEGKPFVGAAGQHLNRMIAAIGFKREEVFICNTLKCRPPQNRDPLPGEKAACEAFLIEQLQIVRPQIIVALGAHAAHYLCRSEEPIARLRGRWFQYEGILLRVTYHPSFLLQKQGKPDERRYRESCWEDFQAIHAKYTELNPNDPRTIWTKK